MNEGKLYMAGTEGTGEYKVVFIGLIGRIGYRDLDDNNYRIRFEPKDEYGLEIFKNAIEDCNYELKKWKTPTVNQNRMSIVKEFKDESSLITYIRDLVNSCDMDIDQIFYMDLIIETSESTTDEDSEVHPTKISVEDSSSADDSDELDDDLDELDDGMTININIGTVNFISSPASIKKVVTKFLENVNKSLAE